VKIISRKQAKEKSLKRYFTGKLCKYGHIAERQTSNGRCLICAKENMKLWRSNNPEKTKEISRRAWAKRKKEKPEDIKKNKDRWNKENHEKVKAMRRKSYKKCGYEYQKKNKDRLNQKARKHYAENREEIQKTRKVYYQDNIEKIRKQNNERSRKHPERARNYVRKRQKNDIQYVIAHRLRSRIQTALRCQWSEKAVESVELLGCTIKEYIFYLEQKFTEGMSWGNRDQWHVDHIKPCVSFDLTDVDQQKECFHYSNTQPMWTIENLQKGGKYESTGNLR